LPRKLETSVVNVSRTSSIEKLDMGDLRVGAR
jgi:hypothetical protein